MPMERVRRDKAISKAEFHERLRTWLDQTNDNTIGPPDVVGVTPWVMIMDGPTRFRLHADTPRVAVSSYLQLVALGGDELTWSVVPNERGNENAVVYGPEMNRITSFYMYLDG